METDIREFPTKDVGDVDNGLSFGLVFGLCDVGLETTDGFYMAFGSAFMNSAADAARRDPDACGHDGNGQENNNLDRRLSVHRQVSRG